VDRTTWRTARAWLAHPVTCVAVLLLLVNDHVLKAAYGTWWTGKLSDVAGLLVAPPLLAVAAACAGRAAPPRRLVGVPVLVVGVGFAVVKSTAAGAAVASGAWSLLAGSSLVRQDPTDLLALPVLGLALLVGRHAAEVARQPEPEPARRRPVPPRWVLVLPLAVLATVATSAVQYPNTTSAKVVDGVAYVEGAESWYRSVDGLTWTDVDDLADGTDRTTPADPDEPPTQVFPDPWSDDVPSDDAPSDAAVDGGRADDGHIDDRRADDGPLDTTDGHVDATDDPAEVVVACTPSGRTCYRPAGRGVGVDQSEDGGRTWHDEWSIPAGDLRAVGSRDGAVGALRTHDVAVLPVVGGYRVVAANGGDGLAVRDVDGAWTRLGHVYVDPDVTVVPLPGELGMRMTYPVYEGVVVGLVAMGAVLLAAGRSPARRSTAAATSISITGVCVSATGTAAVALIRAGTASYPGHVGVWWVFTWLPPVAAVGAALLAVAGAVTAAAVSGRARAIAPALLAGAGAAVAWEQLPPRPVALVVGLVATGLAAWAARAWVSRAAPSDPAPSLPDGPLPR
jgi:hypothetical protein